MNTMQTRAAVEDILKNEAQKKATADLRAEWLRKFNKAASAPAGLAGFAVPPCKAIVGKWFKQGDLGFVHGPRGLGKTWWGMLLARRCAEGLSLGPLPELQVHGPQRVLYVDGEMSLDGIRERDSALACIPTQNIVYLQHEALFHLTGSVLNLTEPEAQAALLDKCLNDKINILVLDNLSCLFSGMRENDADAWSEVLPWLLELRRNRIAVVFIAHSGRNGLMRGTSRREDAAVWIVDLSEAGVTSEVREGARFVARFAKNRYMSEFDCPAIEWTFVKAAGGAKVQVNLKKVVLPERFRECVEAGLTSASEIALDMGVSRGQVSKYAAKAIKDGWLKKERRAYVLATEDEMGRWTKERPRPPVLRPAAV
jgi:hypothetical protein